MLREKLRDVPIEEKWKRNNVEASMFQLGFPCNNGKTRYREIAANQLWPHSGGATWINFRRILKYVMQTNKDHFESKKGSHFPLKYGYIIKNNVSSVINFKQLLPKYLIFFTFLKKKVLGVDSMFRESSSFYATHID